MNFTYTKGWGEQYPTYLYFAKALTKRLIIIRCFKQKIILLVKIQMKMKSVPMISIWTIPGNT